MGHPATIATNYQMIDTLEPKVREQLREYVRVVKTLSNESAKRSRFAALISELFPGTIAVTEFASGVEKLIRIRRSTGVKKGRADAYYGNAIIEFEKKLSSTLKEAEHQLREYVAGSWQKDKEEDRRSLLAIASDGLTWNIYRPVLPPGAEPAPDTVKLDELRVIELNEGTLSDFYLWLTSVLFRDQQIAPTANRFQLDFGATGPLYRETLAALKVAWGMVHREPEPRLALDTWQRYLTVTYGGLKESTIVTKDEETAQEISEMESLFLRHTYLASFAKLLIWAALSKGKSSGDLRQVAKDVLSGSYFKSKRLANLVDDDFFNWVRGTTAEEILARNWERILSHLTEYDLSLVHEDVLKGVYQQLIDPKDRHELGEFYTPDWLTERIVSEMLPDSGYPAVLDPSCGSGSFLRASIAHLLKHNPEGKDNDRLRMILSNVSGIDIHPVAVTISRATYVLALGKLVSAARAPIQIPVFMADSLSLPHEVEVNLMNQLGGFEVTFGAKKDQKTVVMPGMLTNSPELFDDAISACTSIAEEHAKAGKDTRASMEKYLAVAVPELSKQLQFEQISEALWAFTQALADLIRERKNSIWSFIIRNSYRPAMMKNRFDFIIGNPPWVAYRFISDPEYQDEVKRRAVGLYQIAPKSQKLMTQLELATVFMVHSMATFGNTHARLAFVMPRGVLNGDQHQNLILRKYSTTSKLKLTSYWDLWDVVPLFNVPACVLFGKRDFLTGSPHDKLPVLEWSGKLPSRDMPWEAAKEHLKSAMKTGKVIYLGSRAALSTAPGSSSPGQSSKYLKAFRQGATIVPRSFYFVNVHDLDGSVDPSALYWAETDPKQAKQAKKPYQNVKMSGQVEGKFIYSTALSRHLVPFGLLPPITVVLPIELTENNDLQVLKADKLREEGYREFGKWMSQAERLWKDLRGGKAAKQSLYERLDYQGELTNQQIQQRYLVLYNHSGMNVSATYFDRHNQIAPFIVDVKLYGAAFNSRDEAYYVAAVLNSETVNIAIKPFQSTGLLGERDIHKKVLELPIPLFNHESKKHMSLAKLGQAAHEEVRKALQSGEFPIKSSIARQRGFIRKRLKDEMKEMDELAASLLSGQ
jgi:type I restriction-modification system DNA methylase subunit